jgi:hypothetical protein
MGYKIKTQKVQRPTNKSFYVNMPAAIAEALSIEKGEAFEWTIEDKNTLVLKRVIPLEINTRSHDEEGGTSPVDESSQSDRWHYQMANCDPPHQLCGGLACSI